MNNRIIYFALALVVQLAILAAVPARQIYALKTGKTIILKTRSYDPYTVMSGYYVNLNYDISQPDTVGMKWHEDNSNGRINRWPQGGGWYDLREGSVVYVVLQPDSNSLWNAKSCDVNWPQAIPADAVVIKGNKEGWRIIYGIEQYYIPEAMRDTIQRQLSQRNANAKVEIKVDSSGHCALQKLIINNNTYQY